MGVEALPVKLGSPSVPMPGYEIDILDDAGAALPAGELGAIVIKTAIATIMFDDDLGRGSSLYR